MPTRYPWSSILWATVLLLSLHSAPAMASLDSVTAPPSSAETPSRKPVLLDDFEDLSGWSIITSPGAQLEIAQDDGHDGHHAMRLDFEFQEGASFVIARKVFPLRLPENFVFRYSVRGVAPRSDAQFKIVDSRQNVWWFQERDHVFPGDWQPVAVKNGISIARGGRVDHWKMSP